MTDISLDIETLSTGTNAAIVSIGACKFNLETGYIDEKNVFDVNIRLDSPNLGVIDGMTVAWWMKQGTEAIQETFLSADGISLSIALGQLKRWCSPHAKLWTMGPLFDERIIVEACDRLGQDHPTNFRNSRCVRTILDLAKRQGWEKSTGIVNECKHGALTDAVYQAKMMCDAWAVLR